MNKVFFSGLAEKDLAQIIDFIASESPQGARVVLDAIEETCSLIALQPEMGRLREELQ